MSEYKVHLLVCGGTTCKSQTSHAVAENLKAEIKNQGLSDVAQVVTTGCFGLCEKGPIVKVTSGQHFLYAGKAGGCQGNCGRTCGEGQKSSAPAV